MAEAGAYFQYAILSADFSDGCDPVQDIIISQKILPQALVGAEVMFFED